ncbi:hypothetical protein Pflav_058010 [Phytohabitans flavus]|uniref:GTPase Obg n=1 Tax=Phytohabitans flavus TaxID=1076124 RepID=A0A6F8Y088_9ACTN|nr:hypothetical protein Pflav_058010 [Phytohabitans flavus]
MATFVDRVVLYLQAGDGGHGCVSIHREKFKPFGGPDGGNGGHGGTVSLVVDPQVHTLLDFHFRPHIKAENGKGGQGSNRDGANGGDLVLKVPDGTVIQTTGGETIADLVGAGTTIEIARGGRGGRGNAALASSRRKAPGFAELGEPGDRLDVVLELKSVADVGLVGFPSAGKSSLISVLSAAKPKIADYPFTTLVPNLGVVRIDDNTFTIADVPGLIPGAATGKGLGLEFLRHIERCAVLVHVVDAATLEPGRDPLSDIDAIEAELSEYGGLADRPRLVVLNKVDVPDARDLAEITRPDIEARGLAVFEVSTATREGLKELTYALADLVRQARELAPAPEPTRIVIRPPAVDDAGFTITEEAGAYVVRGPGPSGGCGRQTSTTTRRWASSPTGWSGSASRTHWPRPVPSRAIWCGSARGSSTGIRPPGSTRRAREAPTPGWRMARAGPPRPSGSPRTGPGSRNATRPAEPSSSSPNRPRSRTPRTNSVRIWATCTKPVGNRVRLLWTGVDRSPPYQ